MTAGLYPEIEPYEHGMLEAGDSNLVYWETCGNPRGKPAIVLHGGPGSGCSAWRRRLFDPSVYRIVLLDQRGCGRSRPHASAPDTSHRLDLESISLASLGLHLGSSWRLMYYAWAMEPRIQFAKTSDGVNIAYSVTGEGPPLLRIAGWCSHLEMEWNIPPLRQIFERWARHFTLVRLDKRGTGLSDRDQPHDLDARISDIEAVVDHLDLSEVSLVGLSEGGPAAIGFAARHPERVARMALFGTWARGSGVYGGAEVRNAVIAVVKAEWGMGSKLLTELFTGDEGDSEVGKLFTLMQRGGANSSDACRMLEEDAHFDLTGLLEQITAPTLVLHARDDRVVPVALGREVAAGIPGAQLTLVDGPHLGDVRMINEGERIMLEFMTGEEVAKESKVTQAVGDTHTILFTDMQSSTTLADQLGDAAAQEVRRAHNEIVRAALSANAGSEIKHTGDGIMASFSTASAALQAAIAIQRGVAAQKEAHPDSPLAVYVGLNAGEPIAEDDDLFGTAVNLAARICDHAEPGQIVAADVVRQLAAGKQFLFSDLGETELRGFEDPVKLWELRWHTEG